MNNQHSDYITRTRMAVTSLLNAVDELRALDSQRSALDMGGVIDNGTRSEEDVPSVRYGDFDGANKDVTLSDILDITTTLGNIETMLAAGNATNLYKVKM